MKFIRFPHKYKLRFRVGLHILLMLSGLAFVLYGVGLLYVRHVSHLQVVAGFMAVMIGLVCASANFQDLRCVRREQKTPLRVPPLWMLQTPRTWFIVTGLTDTPPLNGLGLIWMFSTKDDADEKVGFPL